MSVDYKKLIAKAKGRMTNNALQLIILGPSGAGKSSLTGTTGLKTLYLYCSGESHGPKAAETYGKGDLDAIMVDDDGRTPDDAIKLTMDILGDHKFIKDGGYKAIAIDGASEFEALIRKTQLFKNGCKTDKGGHNNFAEPTVVLNIFREILAKLRSLSEEGVHYVMTCILDVKAIEDDGSILESQPRLSTYSVAEGIIQCFPDVAVIGKMTNSEVKSAHRIQFGSGISKMSKDAAGRVKKMINFSPRLTGVKELPEHTKASLADIIKLKEAK
jgi:hypothetical protein